MPIQRVQIGETIIESPEIGWESILRISSQLRKIAKWNPREQKWILTWRFYIVYSEIEEALSNLLKNALDDALKQYISQLNTVFKTLLERTPKKIDKGNILNVLVVDCDPFTLVKKVKQKIFEARLVFEGVNIDKFGEVNAPFLSIKKVQLEEFLSFLKEENLLKCFSKEILVELEKTSKKEVYIYSKDGLNLTITAPTIFLRHIVDKVKELSRVEYYLNDPKQGLLKREVTYYKETLKEGYGIIKVPKFVTAKIIKLLEEKRIPYRLGPRVIEPEKEIKVTSQPDLFDYQEDAYRAWKNNNFWGTIVIPTGGGKTFIGLAAISRLKKQSLILVPNLWLLYQWIDRISSTLNIPKNAIGVLGGGEKTIKDITVSTYQSAHRNLDKLGEKFHLVIFDEAHHIPANTFKKVALYLAAPYRMALSATPKRYDGNEILLFKLAGEIVYEISYPELVKKGLVAPLAVRKILVSLPRNLENKYRRVLSKLNYVYDELEKKQVINELIEICRDNPNKLPVIREIVKKHKDEKMFIFAGSIDFAKRIVEEIKSVTKAALLTSETKKSEERKIIKNFIAGVIRVLVLVKKGEEGVDIGDASVAIIAGGTKQKREAIQRIGRILRGSEGKLAWVYEIITTKTIEEKLSRGRRIESLVRGLEDILREKYGVEPYQVITWEQR